MKGYKLWDLKNKKKVLRRNIIFDERLEAKDGDNAEVHEKNHTEVSLSKVGSFSVNHAGVEQAPIKQQVLEKGQSKPTSTTQTRLRRVIKPPQQRGWKDEACYDPSSFKESNGK